MTIGRPAGKMTRRRRQVLAAYELRAATGEPINKARMARECGLHDRQKLNRILRDLQRMGRVPAVLVGEG